MKVFVVEGECGIYSDRTSWLLPTAYLDREAAEGVVKEIEEEVARLEALGEIDWYNYDKEAETIGVDMGAPDYNHVPTPTKLWKLDPSFKHYSSDPTSYTVHELELVGHAEDVARAFGLREST